MTGHCSLSTDVTLQALAAEIASCSRCMLGSSRTRAVPGEGAPGARLMFIGEGPGEREDSTGRPFVGAAGQLLNQLLLQAGLRRPEVFITNIVKCRPPHNRDPEPAEVQACRPYLDAQIALINPAVICLLGRPATQAMLDPEASISRVHGVPRERDGIVFMPLYHPAAALRQASLREVLLEDLRRAGALVASHCPPA